MFSNLQILFSDQEGIHETSAHLWIEGLFQIIDKLKGLLLVALKWLQDFLSVREEFANPRKHVVQLFEKKVNIYSVVTFDILSILTFQSWKYKLKKI